MTRSTIPSACRIMIVVVGVDRDVRMDIAIARVHMQRGEQTLRAVLMHVCHRCV